MEFGSYGERAESEEILVLLVFFVAVAMAIAIIALLMRRKVRVASDSIWRTIPGFGGAVLLGLTVAAMAVPELKIVSLMNQRSSLQTEITQPVIPL